VKAARMRRSRRAEFGRPRGIPHRGEEAFQYRAVVEQSPDGICLIETDGRILEANAAFVRMLGYTAKEVQGLYIFDFVASDREDIERRHRENLAAKGPVAFERRYRHKDGSLLDVWVTVSAISSAGRTFLCAISRDITEWKRTRETLQRREQEIRVIADSVPALFAYLDRDGYYRYVNRRYEDWFGIPRARIIGKHYREVLGEGVHELLKDRVDTVLSGCQVDFEESLPYVHGHLRWVTGHYVPDLDSSGKVKGFFSLVSDITDRKQAEEALAVSEARYRAVMEQSPDAIYLMDAQTSQVLEVNSAFQRMFGYSPEEIPGLTNYDLVAAPREDIDRRFQQVVQAEGPLAYERQFRRKDGSVIDVWISANVISYEGRNIICALVRDLTEHKQAEHALKESEARYRAVVEQSVDAIYLVDVNTKRVVEANTSFQNMLGYSEEEITGLTSYDIVAADRDDVDQVFDKIRRDEGPLFYERRLRRKDHSALEVWLGVSVVSYRGGKVIAVIARDITQRRQAEEALRQSEERYRAVVEQSPDGIVLDHGTSRRLLEANTAFCRLLGYSPEEVAALSVYDIVAAEREDIDRRFQQILGREVPFFHERTYRKKDGSLVEVWLNSKVISYGGVSVVCTFVRDLTDRKRAEAEISQRNRELTTLLSTSLRLASRLDVEELLNTIVASVTTTLPAAEMASLWLYDGQRNELIARTCAGCKEETFSGMAVSPDTSLVGLVYRSRQPQIVNDLSREPTFGSFGWPLADGATSFLGVPLMIDEEPIGTLVACNYQPTRSFGENDRILLQSLAAQAAVAIQNAQLFEQIGAGRERLQALSQRLVEVQEAERRRIARELHDEIGQALTALKIDLQGAQRLVKRPELAGSLQESIKTVERTLQQVRSLSLDLRPSILDDLGLIPALRWYVDRHGQQGGLRAHFTADTFEGRLRPEIEIACFRVAQEALTNVMRHAEAKEVTVELRKFREELELIIRDDGSGFDVNTALERASQGASLGLLGMEERARLVGGRISFESSPKQGTEIRVYFPLTRLRHSGMEGRRRH
jgi:PAS domain S-box-containing protein